MTKKKTITTPKYPYYPAINIRVSEKEKKEYVKLAKLQKKTLTQAIRELLAFWKEYPDILDPTKVNAQAELRALKSLLAKNILDPRSMQKEREKYAKRFDALEKTLEESIEEERMTKTILDQLAEEEEE